VALINDILGLLVMTLLRLWPSTLSQCAYLWGIDLLGEVFSIWKSKGKMLMSII